MRDPYEVLGVSPDASDDDVKAAYRVLARQYHSSNYYASPLADLAQKRMQETDEAYNEILKRRIENPIEDNQGAGKSAYPSSNKNRSGKGGGKYYLAEGGCECCGRSICAGADCGCDCG